MRSFVNVKPGKTRSCSGCHETWEAAPGDPPRIAALALQRPPSEVTLPVWANGPVVVNYLRDVQPMLERYCVRGHSGLKPAKGLALDGGLTPLFSRSYETIWSNNLVAAYHGESDTARVELAPTPGLYTKPLTYGSRVSKLIQVLASGHQDLKLDPKDMATLIDWVDADAPYYLLLSVPGAEYSIPTDPSQPPLAEIAAIQARRCATCHQSDNLLRAEWADIRQPARTLFLDAPLAKAAGGRGSCGDSAFRDTSDPDYQATLRVVKDIVANLWAHPRKDVQALIDAGQNPRPADVAQRQ